MRLKRLRIRGVTRFVDEAIVDFESLGPGVHAVTGPNGAGKTTIVEASGPGIFYRELPSRDPSPIQNWVGPRGGSLALDFVTSRGEAAEAAIEIGSRGVKSATLSIDGKPVCTGKVRDYAKVIEEILGPKAAFYTSAFGVQGGRGRFGSLDVADRKAVFGHYLSLDRLVRCHSRVRARLATIDTEAVARAEAAVEEAKRSVEAAGGAHDRAAEAKADAESKRAIERDACRRVTDLAAIVDRVEEYRAALREVVKAEGDLVALGEPPAPVRDGEIESIKADLAEMRARVARVAALDGKITTAIVEVRRAEERLASAARLADNLAAVPCKAEGECAACEYLADGVAAKDRVPGLSEAVAKAKAEVVRLRKEKDAAAAAVGGPGDLDPVAEIEGLLDEMVTVRDLTDRIDRAQVEVKRCRDRALAIRAKLPKAIPTDLPTIEDVRQAERDLGAVEDAYDAAVADEARAAESLSQWADELVRREKTLTTARSRAGDATPLLLLDKALGPGGIQAMEIAAAGPEVSSIANDLLLACYGPRFEIEITTLRELKSREGLADDFEIRVHDAARGVTNTIDGLSKGEGVVVDEALRTALTLFSRSRTEMACDTLWRDETVGDLDPENAARYVDLLRRAREIGGFHQVLYVVHDERMIAAADGVIRVDEDGRITTGVA
jgi:exonuclease SbcC